MKFGRLFSVLLVATLTATSLAAPTPARNKGKGKAVAGVAEGPKPPKVKFTPPKLTQEDHEKLEGLAKQAQDAHPTGAFGKQLVTTAGLTDKGRTLTGTSLGNDIHGENNLISQLDDGEKLTHVASFGNSRPSKFGAVGLNKVVGACAARSTKPPGESCHEQLSKQGAKFHTANEANKLNQKLKLPTTHDPDGKGSHTTADGSKAGPAGSRNPETGKVEIKPSPGHLKDKPNDAIPDSFKLQSELPSAKKGKKTEGEGDDEPFAGHTLDLPIRPASDNKKRPKEATPPKSGSDSGENKSPPRNPPKKSRPGKPKKPSAGSG